MKAIRKFLLCILCLAALSAAVFGLSACGEEEFEECPHSWNSWETVIAPTCQAEGLERRACKLDSTHTEERTVEKLDHSFENYVSNNDATCAKNGTKTAYCATIGCTVSNTVDDIGSQLPHSFTEKIVDDDYLLSAASCTKPARYYYSCDCGACGTETFEDGEILHSFGTALVYDEENHWYECEVCEEDNELAPHTWDEGETVSQATCTEDGKILYTCECGATREDITPAHHTLVFVAKIPATCTAEGTEAHWRCSVEGCGKKFTDNKGENEITEIKISIIAHSYTAWAHDENGHSKKCSWCDDTLAETASHVLTSNYNSTHHYIGCECGYKYGSEEHNISIEKNANSHWDKCTDCGYRSEKSQHTNEIHYSEYQHWSVCSYCNYTLQKENHSYDAGVVTTAPSCTTYGVKTYTCSCGSTVTESIIPSHTYGEIIDEVDSTCTETGTIAHYVCTVCEKSFINKNGETQDLTIPIKAHKLTYKHNDNEHWSVCEDCNYIGATLSHEFFPSGDENQHWDECVCSYKENVKNHNWGNGIETLAADCFNDGEKTYTCFCSATKTEVILHHRLVEVSAVEPTTCTDGQFAHLYCEVCSDTYYKLIDGIVEKDPENNPIPYTLAGIVIPATHDFENAEIAWDDNYHWLVCNGENCEKESAKEPHSYGTKQDEAGAWIVCTHGNCGYKKKIEQ